MYVVGLCQLQVSTGYFFYYILQAGLSLLSWCRLPRQLIIIVNDAFYFLYHYVVFALYRL